MVSPSTGSLAAMAMVRGQLVLAAVGHQHSACADGGVEALGQTLLAADVQVGDQVLHLLLKGSTGKLGLPDMTLAGCARWRDASPHRWSSGSRGRGRRWPCRSSTFAHALFLGHGGNDRSFEVFLGGVLHKGLGILGSDGHGHTLLALGDGQLGAVQTLIFLSDLVQVDLQAVGQLTDGNRDTACAKVVAALDEAAGIARGGTGAAAYAPSGALPFCTSAPQVSRLVSLWALEEPVAPPMPSRPVRPPSRMTTSPGAGRSRRTWSGRRCAHDCADLHALGSVAGVIQFRDLAGGKANLVAVAGVTGSGGGDQLALGQLAGHRLGDRLQRVGCAGHAHGLVDVAAAGQGVADGTADAGGSTAERLDLGGVVVGLILKQKQPVLQLAVDIAR